MSLDGFLDSVEHDNRFAREILHHEVLPPRRACYGSLDPPLPEPLRQALRRIRINKLFSHQVEAVQLARQGKNVVAVTPTASGKTLAYALPIFERALNEPDSRALLLFPLKALAQDQLKRLNALAEALGLDENFAAIYDGDTPQHVRTRLRKHPPNLLLTNPDMLHHGILAFHTRWAGFFRNLKVIVIDEIHTYRGIFGSHVLQILRRLSRVAAFHGAKPQFIATSATIANPGELAGELTGQPFNVVDDSGAPASRRHIVFINPVGSVYTTAVRLFSEAIRNDCKTIIFTKARKVTELIHRWILQSEPDLAGEISAYRAGYLPSERREIERGLKSGELKGVISTSALEMGVDIGGLDVCVLAGYPGTITNTWQRAGRVGRGTRESAVFLVALPDALDQYFMRHPGDFFRRSAEAAVVDAANPYLLKSHLACAAQEIPLRADETVYPGEQFQGLVAELIKEGVLAEAAAGRVWFSTRKQPHRLVNIRGAGSTYPIHDASSGNLIGYVSGLQAMTECHPGAVYLHHGQSYVVEKLDLGTEEVRARRKNVHYYTLAMMEKETEILEVYHTRRTERFTVSLGLVKVTEQVVGYERRSTAGRDKIDEHELDLPPVVYETVGLWIQPGEETIIALAEHDFHPMGSLHAVEHASLALLPVFALCDRSDVGGISFTIHPQLKKPAVFLYDGFPGGVGLAAKTYEIIDDLLARVRSLVEKCPCEDGCPSCIHSPKCGHGNIPLDKQGAVRLLRHLTDGELLRPVEKNESEMLKTAVNRSGKSTGSGDLAVQSAGNPPPVKKRKPFRSRLNLAEGRDIVVFDLETQLSAEEVGGWHNAHRMRVSVGVVFERKTGNYLTYHEDRVPELIERLTRAELVVGFNSKRFDYAVLSAYSGTGLASLPSLDLLEEIYRKHGFRIKLDSLGKATLHAPKGADGLQALQWWKEGRIEEIERYCRKDVEITARLFDYALDNGYLLVEQRGHIVRLPLEFPLEKYLKKLDRIR